MIFKRYVTSRTGVIEILLDSSDLVSRNVTNDVSKDLTALLIVTWVLLLSDSPIDNSGNRKPASVFRRFLSECSNTFIKDTIVRYSSLADDLMETLNSTGGESCIRPFLSSFLDTPVFKEYHEFWKTGNPDLLRYLLTFLQFGKKLEYEDEDLNQVAFRAWRGVEDKLSDLVLPDTSDLAKIIHFALDHVDDFPALVKHGSGAVADGQRGFAAKTSQLRYHPRLDKAFFDNTMLKKRPSCNPRAIIPDALMWESDKILGIASSDVSELMFVPKTVKTSRSICMEPTSFMYFQQMLRKELEDAINRGPFGEFVTINDQSRNQKLAMLGSCTGMLDTIDLSAASDSVSCSLVKKIFPRSFLMKMLGSRTNKVRLPSGEVIKVAKFAPMGSAVCFPTQCIIFCGIVVLSYSQYLSENFGIDVDLNTGAIYKYISKNMSYSYSSRVLAPISVYGDDIICDSRVTPTVIRNLQAFGFVVNESKSFMSSQSFRESCGKFYFCGEDVTPLRFRVKPFSGTLNASCVTSLVANCNNFLSGGYYNARKSMLQTLKFNMPRGMENGVLYTSNPHVFGILTERPLNDGLRRREQGICQCGNIVCSCASNLKYQRDEVRCVVILPKKVKRFPLDDPALEKARYIAAQRAAYLRGDDDSDILSEPLRYDSFDQRLGWRWTPS